MICRANQWTVFFMIETSVMKELQDFLKNRQKGAVLNGQFSSWTNANEDVLHRDQFCELYSFLYIKATWQTVYSLAETFLQMALI